MAAQRKEELLTHTVSEAIANVSFLGALFAKAATGTAQCAAENAAIAAEKVSQTVVPPAQRAVEQGTETIGRIVTPIVDNPWIKYASKVPGIRWLMSAVGQIDAEAAQREVEELRRTYPQESSEQLAQRIMADAALRGGGIGFLMNVVPPVALALFALDLAAITALQAEMVYRIAAAYGFSLQDPARRGEVLAIFGLSLGGSSVLKVGLGVVELVPGVGAVAGASSNAALLYSLGYAACRFYENKLKGTQSLAA